MPKNEDSTPKKPNAEGLEGSKNKFLKPRNNKLVNTMAPGTLPRKSIGKSVDFYICHDKSDPTKFHFHEFTGSQPNRHTCGKNC